MGLLMYGYKEAGDGGKKDTLKKDPTAASRSAIRRYPTVRRRDNALTERRNGHASPRAVRLSLSNYVVDDRDGEFVIAPRPRARAEESVGYWDADSRPTYRAEVEEHLRVAAEDRLAMRAEERIQTRAAQRQRRALLPATARPEGLQSGDRAQSSRSGDWTRESVLRNLYNPDDDDGQNRVDRAIIERAAAIDRPGQDWIERTRQYWAERGDRTARRASPGRYAPALIRQRHASPTPSPTRPRSTDRRSRSPPHHNLREASRISTPAVLSPNFPPLERQVARQQRAGVSAPRHDPSTADGLGDRQRSLSPGPGDGAWETLMTTITNDEHLPSTESSFTSAAASASFSSLGELRPASVSEATSPSIANAIDSGIHRDRDCDEPGAGMQTPDSLPDLVPGDRDGSVSGRPNNTLGEDLVMNLDGANESSSLAQSFEEAREELERDIEVYSRSRMQRLLGSFLSRGERVPEELWQTFVPRNVLAGAAEMGTGQSGDSH